MTEDERNATFERITNIVLLSLETVAENFAAVVAGEKRIAVVPRKHPKVKAGLIHELRLVRSPSASEQQAETDAERVKDGTPVDTIRQEQGMDPADLDDLANSIGSTPAPVIPADDPEFDSDVGDTCCDGGPFLGHSADCPQGEADRKRAAEKHLESIMSTVPDRGSERLAGLSFDDEDWKYHEARYRK